MDRSQQSPSKITSQLIADSHPPTPKATGNNPPTAKSELPEHWCAFEKLSPRQRRELKSVSNALRAHFPQESLSALPVPDPPCSALAAPPLSQGRAAALQPVPQGCHCRRGTALRPGLLLWSECKHPPGRNDGCRRGPGKERGSPLQTELAHLPGPLSAPGEGGTRGG